jgi:hypothetical protein
MKHASTRAVYAHWNERRGSRVAPGRNEIDPLAIRQALGDTFMLSEDFVDQLRFRLAGTRVCALFCREIKGEIFSDLWSQKTRSQIEDILAIVSAENSGAVAGLTGRTEDNARLDLEMLLLLLARIGRGRVCTLGVLAPLAPAYWIGEKPVVEIEVDTVRYLRPEQDHLVARRLTPPVGGSDLRHGLRVYSGGREEPLGKRSARSRIESSADPARS